MSNRELHAVTSFAGLCVRMVPCILCCVLWTRALPAHAQERTSTASGQQVPRGAVAQVASPSDVELHAPPLRAADEVVALRSEVEQARFDAAVSRAQSLLTMPTLSARERNDTLELLAIAQLAGRDEQLAQGTLSELFARDPEHPQRMRDPGPNVEAFFARVRAQQHPSLAAQLTVAALHDAEGRVLVEVVLGASHDAIETVHVFSRAPRPGITAVAGATQGARADATPDETAHGVVDVAGRERVRVMLPSLPSSSPLLELYVEARAPSGYVLARDGSADAPLRVHLEPNFRAASQNQDPPLARTWWLWTSLAIVVAGAGVTGALVAQ